jgi:DNA topoisomerase-1
MPRRATKKATLLDPAASAKSAGLRYVSDASPGIRRKKSGKGFTYVGPDGKTVRDKDTLKRIKSIVIPPAWTDVWICLSPQGHVQATGRDAKGRKQHRYHPRWREVRDEDKYERMIAFGEALPKLRKKLDEDLGQRGLPRTKVLATVVRLLELTLIRVGNEEYARANESYGLTTLRDKHVQVEGSKLRFRFQGKSAKLHEVEISDRRVAAIVKRCKTLPGQELFQYLDDEGNVQSIGSADVNDYLRETMGEEFTAKDFRTWSGTILAAETLRGEVAEDVDAKSRVVAAIKRVAKRLGNTPATCRKHYIHPLVLEAFQAGRLAALEGKDADLAMQEAALLKLLKAGAA